MVDAKNYILCVPTHTKNDRNVNLFFAISREATPSSLSRIHFSMPVIRLDGTHDVGAFNYDMNKYFSMEKWIRKEFIHNGNCKHT